MPVSPPPRTPAPTIAAGRHRIRLVPVGSNDKPERIVTVTIDPGGTGQVVESW
jgi:hypothetical protein